MTDEFKGVTIEQLKACMPYASEANIDRFHGPLNMAMSRYQIHTSRRQAAFLAQIAHESGSLSKTRENLNYSAKRLLEVFPKYFTEESAVAYANKPEMIANRVYADRYGNGPESSGDGWKYSGRGLFMITFKDNYDAVSRALSYGFINSPEKLELPGAASLSAGWFWNEKGLNRLADIDAFTKITKIINGGTNGLEDRIEHWERCKKALKVIS
jgi:putative chitinase